MTQPLCQSREKLHSRIHLDTAAASNAVEKALAATIGEGELDTAAASRHTIKVALSDSV